MTEQRKYSLFFLIAINAVIASACHSFTTPHENFKKHMQFNVGRRVDDPASSLARYPEWVVDEKKLTNGNSEIEYYRGKHCAVYFEVDNKTEVIIGWRFVGSEKSCVIVP